MTGRERRRWHPAGTDRNEASELAARLAAQCAPTQTSVGLTVATFMLRRWLPAKRVSLRPSTWDGYRRLVEGPGQPQRRRPRRSAETPPASEPASGVECPTTAGVLGDGPNAPALSGLLTGRQHRYAPE
jgi:hypothetical protein